MLQRAGSDRAICALAQTDQPGFDNIGFEPSTLDNGKRQQAGHFGGRLPPQYRDLGQVEEVRLICVGVDEDRTASGLDPAARQ
jgi:hypothetical protein